MLFRLGKSDEEAKRLAKIAREEAIKELTSSSTETAPLAITDNPGNAGNEGDAEGGNLEGEDLEGEDLEEDDLGPDLGPDLEAGEDAGEDAVEDSDATVLGEGDVLEGRSSMGSEVDSDSDGDMADTEWADRPSPLDYPSCGRGVTTPRPFPRPFLRSTD